MSGITQKRRKKAKKGSKRKYGAPLPRNQYVFHVSKNRRDAPWRVP
jgi:hypothetical protein